MQNTEPDSSLLYNQLSYFDCSHSRVSQVLLCGEVVVVMDMAGILWQVLLVFSSYNWIVCRTDILVCSIFMLLYSLYHCLNDV